jgi:hypothetical protein
LQTVLGHRPERGGVDVESGPLGHPLSQQAASARPSWAAAHTNGLRPAPPI